MMLLLVLFFEPLCTPKLLVGDGKQQGQGLDD